MTTVTDPRGKWKQYTNDVFGNLVTVLEPDPAHTGTQPPVPATSQYPLAAAPPNSNTLFTGYTYDPLNHLTLVTMPRSTGTQTRSFVYDSNKQLLTSATNPENGTIRYAYRDDSTLLTKTFNNGDYEQYGYDIYQRLTTIQRFVCSSTCQHPTEDTNQLQTFTYDTLNGVPYPGLLTSATFAKGLGSNSLTLQNQYTYTTAGQIATKALSVSNTSASGSLTVSYGYDHLGALTSIGYPSPSTLGLTYTLDSLERPTGLTDTNNYTWASAVQYDAANHMTNATFPSGTETWVYNTLQQLQHRTTVSGTKRLDMTYNYTAGADNGQVQNTVDAVTGETITYQYDSLKRLAGATSRVTGPGTLLWSEIYTYDGFGNLTGMTPGGGAPPLTVAVDPNTNRILPTNIMYDNGNGNGNGNVTQFGPSGAVTTLGYDVANRVTTVNGTSTYAYDSANQRVYFNSGSTETLYVYGTDGKKLAAYTIAGIVGNQVNFTFQSRNVYFAGKLISAEGNAVAVDELGSVRWSAASGGHTYYPYGVEYNATTNDTEKYATYPRDELTKLDYARNRYYSSIWGRFISPDPSWKSAEAGNPQSWNRYPYALNEPVGRSDPSGLNADFRVGEFCDAEYSYADCVELGIIAPEAGSVHTGAAGPDGLPCGWMYGTVCGISPIVFAPDAPDPTAPASADVPTYLGVVDDCYERDLGTGLVRRREYQVLDQYGYPFGVGDALVIEHIVGGNNLVGGGEWITEADSSGNTGVFFDFYSVGGNRGPTSALQTYNGASLTGSVWNAVMELLGLPLIVLEPQGGGTVAQYQVQGVYYSSTYVRIDHFSRNPYVTGKQGCTVGPHLTNLSQPAPWGF